MCLHASQWWPEMAMQQRRSLPESTRRICRHLYDDDDHDNHQLWRVQVSAVDSLLLRSRRRRCRLELQQRRLSGDAADRVVCGFAHKGAQLRVRGDSHHVRLWKRRRWRLSVALQWKDDSRLSRQLARQRCRLLDFSARHSLFLSRRERHGRALYLRERREWSRVALRERLTEKAPTQVH